MREALPAGTHPWPSSSSRTPSSSQLSSPPVLAMTRSGPQASGPLVLDFVSSSVGGEGVEVARKVVPAGTVVRQGGDFPSPRNAREVVTFLSFLMVGMAPPFSPFLAATHEEYAIHLVHLTPNAAR